MNASALKLLLWLFASLGLMVSTEAAEPEPEPVPRMVKPEVFHKRYQRVGMAETMHVTEMVGVRDGVAILKIADKSPLIGKWREQHIGVKLADLDPKLRAEVEKAAAKHRSE